MGINRNKVLNAARKQVRKGNWKKAVEKYEQLVDDDPSDARSMLKVADLYSKLDRTQQALDAYQAVANHYADEDIYEKAVAVYKQALRLASDIPELHRDLGDAYHRLGRLKDAVRSYHKAQKIYKKTGNVTAQRELLERMIRLDPDDVGMRIQLAERYAKDDLGDQALELFEIAADNLDEEGRIDEFVQVAERIIYLKEDAVDLRRRVIDIYLRRGDNKRALKHLQVCFKKRPQDIGILELLGEVFRRLERFDKAVLVMHELANLYQSRVREDEAVPVYEQILEIEPADKRAQSRLRKLRRPHDSGAMTGPRETGPADAQRNDTSAEDQEVDALDGIEFLDEDDADIEVVEVEQSARQPAAENEVSRGEASEDIETIEAVEPTIEESGPQATEEQVARELTETDVFIKYGLYDKAYETIVGVIAKHPDSLQAREQMRKLQEARGNPEGAVVELLEMARITRTTPARAERFLAEALELTDDEARVRQAAEKFGLAFGTDSPAEEPDEISVVEVDADPAGAPEGDELLELDMGDVEFVEPSAGQDESDEQSRQNFAPQFGDTEEAGIEISEIELDDADLEDLQIIEDDEADVVEASNEELGFDESTFDDAEVVDMDVDVDGLAELSDEMVELGDDDSAADFGFDLTEEEADQMFDDLFGDAHSTGEDVNLGGDDQLGELAEVDFFLQQGLFTEAEEALKQVRAHHPEHPGIEARASQIEAARQGSATAGNPFGSESLSQKFHPSAEGEPSQPLEQGDGEVHNTSIELGTAYREMGLYDEAIGEFEQALDDPQASGAARFHIALCEFDKGDVDAAIARLNTLLQQEDLDAGLRAAIRDKLDEMGA